MKKILCIVQLPPPVHGVSLMNNYVVNSEVIQKLASVDVIKLKFGKTISQLEKFSFTKVLIAVKYVFLISKKVIQFRPDLVYFTLAPTGYAFYRDAVYVLILKLLRCNVVLHLHGKGIKRDIAGKPFKTRLYKFVFKNTHIICLSKTLSLDVENVYNATPLIVNNGVTKYVDTYKKTASGNKVIGLLYLSNFIRSKGLLILIEALGRLKKKGHHFSARFVGAPSDITIENLNELIRSHNLADHVTILGPLTGMEKNREFEKADIFVFPTLNDSFPLVTLEAMQFGLPVVSTIEGSIPDIVIDNETGFLVPKNDVCQLADKIESLIVDPDLRNEMGRKGYQRFVSNYTLECFEHNMSRAFSEILAA